jgi:hypothetical protein
MGAMNFLHITVCGIPAQAKVTSYTPYQPMRITGCGFGDAEPPESEEVEFELYDRNGYRAKWLEKKLEDRQVYADVERQILDKKLRIEKW